MVTSPSREDTRVVTESSGRGFREGLINLTTANPATLNFLVTIFTAAHCGTQAGRQRAGGFARRRFFPPRVGKFHFPRQFFPSRGLFNSCKRCALCVISFCNWAARLPPARSHAQVHARSWLDCASQVFALSACNVLALCFRSTFVVLECACMVLAWCLHNWEYISNKWLFQSRLVWLTWKWKWMIIHLPWILSWILCTARLNL